MKRLILTIFVSLFIFAISCSKSNDDYNEIHQAMVNDFNYMVSQMRLTFPHLGVAERKLGLDFEALVTETRSIIKNYPQSMQDYANEVGIELKDMPLIDEQVLWSILKFEFFNSFKDDHNLIAHAGISSFMSFNNERFLLDKTTESHKTYQQQKELYTMLPEQDPLLFEFLFRADSKDFTLLEYDFEQTVFFCEILEENKIAYLKIASFWCDYSPYKDLLNEYFINTRNYDHLIIDIRDASGGHSDAIEYIMNPLWPDRDNLPTTQWFTFVQGSQRVREAGEYVAGLGSGWKTGWYSRTNSLVRVGSLLEEYQLPLRNIDDFKYLEYGFVYDFDMSTIYHSVYRTRSYEPGRFPFGGRIWLLTSNKNYSASAIFAQHAKDIGFATLVGETVSGGITVLTPLDTTLPNSGLIVSWDPDYVTDQYGRSLVEFPTEPHYFNREGMDALETVLQMIEEMG